MKLIRKTPQKVQLEMSQYEVEFLRDLLKLECNLAPEDETTRNRFLVTFRELEDNRG